MPLVYSLRLLHPPTSKNVDLRWVQAVVGINFDIIGFDLRGIYYREPLANCSVKTLTQRRGVYS